MRWRAALAWRSPPRFRRCRLILPEDAGIGLTPHRAAKAASEWSRSGLLPAVTSRAAAVSDPIPKMLTRAGDAFGVRHAGVDRAQVCVVSGAAVWIVAPLMALARKQLGAGEIGYGGVEALQRVAQIR